MRGPGRFPRVPAIGGGPHDVTRLLAWLGTDPTRALSRQLPMTGVRAGDLALLLALRQFPDEGYPETLRRLIGDDLGRTRDPGDRRLLAYTAAAERGPRAPVIVVRVTEETRVRVEFRTRALDLGVGSYLRLLILRATALREQGVTIAPDPDEPQRQRGLARDRLP